jgi:hypothetical protein
MAAVGRTKYSPLEAAWEELEAEMDRLRVTESPGYPITDRVSSSRTQPNRQSETGSCGTISWVSNLTVAQAPLQTVR